ncbi:hypothetical protein [Granulicella tundricola]|uniref:Uncharacterized protein n=1 Tax=Granulicella tundricola (strain ATCC BAA-1859 / DSM 23138 / MP5ACTX9) TaxID=1198114 RepID=E8X0B9_GRATM|nr:hypothetical protein [Granulicella tundricola]ADW70100.1 hypothetical protein AciX9_3080 [Granulicella tundricola MP5ACTX9]
MDAGRFGRALGQGAREAAKAAVQAAEAAAAPSPAPSRRTARPAPATPIIERARETVSQSSHHTVQTAQGIKRGGKRFGEAIWGPFAKLSSVLILEVTGVLFGMFALVAASEVWKGRHDFHAAAAEQRHEIFAIIMLAVFGYFTLSSFLRASRRQRR